MVNLRRCTQHKPHHENFSDIRVWLVWANQALYEIDEAKEDDVRGALLELEGDVVA